MDEGRGSVAPLLRPVQDACRPVASPREVSAGDMEPKAVHPRTLSRFDSLGATSVTQSSESGRFP